MTGTTLEGELLTLVLVIGIVLLTLLVFDAPVVGEWVKKQIGKGL